jgi:hypothetical protein
MVTILLFLFMFFRRVFKNEVPMLNFNTSTHTHTHKHTLMYTLDLETKEEKQLRTNKIKRKIK